MTPTAEGLRRMSGVCAARIELYERILAGWSERDRGDLARLLGRLYHDMEQTTRTFSTLGAS